MKDIQNTIWMCGNMIFISSEQNERYTEYYMDVRKYDIYFE